MTIIKKTSGYLWQYYKDEPALDDRAIVDFPANNNNNSASFKFKTETTNFNYNNNWNQVLKE